MPISIFDLPIVMTDKIVIRRVEKFVLKSKFAKFLFNYYLQFSFYFCQTTIYIVEICNEMK